MGGACDLDDELHAPLYLQLLVTLAHHLHKQNIVPPRYKTSKLVEDNTGWKRQQTAVSARPWSLEKAELAERVEHDFSRLQGLAQREACGLYQDPFLLNKF